jgi:hypothetical protein
MELFAYLYASAALFPAVRGSPAVRIKIGACTLLRFCVVWVSRVEGARYLAVCTFDIHISV